MLALTALSAGWQALFFGLALILFIIAAVRTEIGAVTLVPVALAFFSFVWFWNALAGI